jgi:O-succinylbenzoate synthase
MRATLYRQDVVLERQIQASGQSHIERSRLFLELESDGVVGYGEVSPQPFELNGDPGIGTVLDAIASAVTLLQGVENREGTLPLWSRLGGFSSGLAQENVAFTVVEMALLDRELCLEAKSINDLWPARFDTPLQVTVSLVDELAPWVIDADAQRVRVKSIPGSISDAAMKRLSALSVPVILDYNCSVVVDTDVLEQLEQLRGVVDIAAVEQPYGVGNVVEHARLAQLLNVPISIDEGLRSLRDLTHIAQYGAAQMVCVKPARVGGLANARTIIAKASELGIGAYIGGFFESPYARSVHQSLAKSCVQAPSDIGKVEISSSAEAEFVVINGRFGVEPSRAMLASATPHPLISVLES